MQYSRKTGSWYKVGNIVRVSAAVVFTIDGGVDLWIDSIRNTSMAQLPAPKALEILGAGAQDYQVLGTFTHFKTQLYSGVIGTIQGTLNNYAYIGDHYNLMTDKESLIIPNPQSASENRVLLLDFQYISE